MLFRFFPNVNLNSKMNKGKSYRHHESRCSEGDEANNGDIVISQYLYVGKSLLIAREDFIRRRPSAAASPAHDAHQGVLMTKAVLANSSIVTKL